MNQKIMIGLAVGVVVAIVGGCAGRPTILPHSDKSMRKTSAEFAADAAKRKYPTEAPRGGEAVARAEIGYMLNRLVLVNLSDADWQDVEVWVNEKYVVFVPTMPKNQIRSLDFPMIYDDSGHYFPTNNRKTLVSKVEILRDGTLYTVPTRLGD